MNKMNIFSKSEPKKFRTMEEIKEIYSLSDSEFSLLKKLASSENIGQGCVLRVESDEEDPTILLAVLKEDGPQIGEFGIFSGAYYHVYDPVFNSSLGYSKERGDQFKALFIAIEEGVKGDLTEEMLLEEFKGLSYLFSLYAFEALQHWGLHFECRDYILQDKLFVKFLNKSIVSFKGWFSY